MGCDRWSEMLPEVLEAISDRLPLREFVSFRGVCRRWRSVPSGRSGITEFSKGTPWLMFYGSSHDGDAAAADDTACYLYGSHRDRRKRERSPDSCRAVLRLPHLRGATVMQSKSGWLFARRDDGHFFLHNPFTLAKVDLPDHEVHEDQVCGMSAAPPPASSAFVVSRRSESTLEVSLCRAGDSEWTRHAVEMSKDKLGAMTAVYEKRKGASLAIYGRGTVFLVYDYTAKRSVVRRRPRGSTKKPSEVELGEEERRHRKNYWLQMFGGEGAIKISTCPLSMRLPESKGIMSGPTVVARDGDGSSPNARLELVKSSWIEPKFI